MGEGERAVLPALHASFLLNPVVRPPIGADASSWAKPSVRIWRRRSARSSHNDHAGGGRRPGAVAGKQSSSERTDVGERTHDNAAGAPEFADCRARDEACKIERLLMQRRVGCVGAASETPAPVRTKATSPSDSPVSRRAGDCPRQRRREPAPTRVIPSSPMRSWRRKGRRRWMRSSVCRQLRFTGGREAAACDANHAHRSLRSMTS